MSQKFVVIQDSVKSRNDDINGGLNLASVEEKLVQRRFRWLGHVQHRPLEAAMHSEILSCDNNLKRWRGWPSVTWDEATKEAWKSEVYLEIYPWIGFCRNFDNVEARV